jgi:hypothetical protein
MSRKIYLAASFSRKKELNKYRSDIIRWGGLCTASWLFEAAASDTDPIVDDAYRRRCAETDLLDVWRSDTLVSFTGCGCSGGRHVELGLALSRGIECLAVGPREHIFHYLERVTFFDDWTACLQHIRTSHLNAWTAHIQYHKGIR